MLKFSCPSFMLRIILPALMITLFLPGAAWSQMSEQDLDALRERGRQEGWTFIINQNPATHYSLEQLCGAIIPPDWQVGANFDLCTPSKDLPERFDWRDSGACTPIRNQDGCGSCWAFSIISVVESSVKIIDGLTVDLSEQWLISCNDDSMGCGGGGFAAFDHLVDDLDPCDSVGPVMEVDFPYLASDAPCGCPYLHRFRIDSWSFIGDGVNPPAVAALKQAIIDYGPISIDVHVNPAMQAYGGGIFNDCESGQINHMVDLVGWDDNQGTEGIWFMRNSWGKGWGEDGYMRIPYGCNRVGEVAAYSVYSGAKEIDFSFPAGLPLTVEPGCQATILVDVEGVYGGIAVTETGRIHYSLNDGEFVVEAMTEISDNHYLATLPVIDCGEYIKYYFSAQEASKGWMINPVRGKPYRVIAATSEVIVFADDFESDQGWTVSGNAVSGHWERGVPIGGGDRGDPPMDFDGSGSCYLTDNTDGNSDIEYGITILTSPILENSGIEPRVHYAHWFCNDAGIITNVSYMDVFVSNDDGDSWIPVGRIGPAEESSGGWYEKELWISDYITPAPQMRIRFGANSEWGNDEIVEAGVDDISVKTYLCNPYICGDANGDLGVNIGDVVYIANHVFRNGECSVNPPIGCPPVPYEAGDVNCDISVNIGDAVYLGNVIFRPGSPLPCANCP